jgi:hypothetical protein
VLIYTDKIAYDVNVPNFRCHASETIDKGNRTWEVEENVAQPYIKQLQFRAGRS